MVKEILKSWRAPLSPVKKPCALRAGSRIRIVAPASSPEPTKLKRGLAHLRGLGFDIELDQLVRTVSRRGYLAGPDEARAAAVNAAFADPSVDGIICSNGGYGSQRLLRHLDFKTIAANPKVFVGFSDITMLHVAIGKAAGFVTFHGPMAAAGPDYGVSLQWSRERLFEALTSTEPLGPVVNPPGTELVRTVKPGRASGPLVGGNLTLVAASLGTPWEIDTRGRVLLLEEWKEPPYTVDTMLMQLKLAGKLDDAAAIVFGEFPHVLPLEPGPTLYVEELIQDIMEDVDRPAIFGVAAGHGFEAATLPLGVKATVDGDDSTLTFDEAALTPT